MSGSLVVLEKPEHRTALLRAAGRDPVVASLYGDRERVDGGHEPLLSDAEHADIEARALRWLKALAHDTADPSGPLVQALSWGPVSLWWYLEASFHRHTFKHVARSVGSVGRAIDLHKPKQLVVAEDGGLVACAASAVARARGCEVVRVKPHFAGFATRSSDVRDRLRGTLLSLRDRARALAAPTPLPAGPGARILIASANREEVVCDPRTGRPCAEDLMLGPVLRALAADARASVLQLYKYPYSDRIRVPEGLNAPGRRVRPWEAYIDGSSRRRMREAVDALTGRWRMLRAGAEFRGAWRWDGVDLWPVVAASLDRAVRRDLPLAVRHIVLAERVMEIERPQAVLLASETSLDNKPLVTAARRRGIPVIAVQHGNIAATDDYLSDFSIDPRDLDGAVSKEWLFPDRLCISGEDTRQLLREGIGYPFPERLVVTGQPRMDPLARPGARFDRGRFCRAFGIDPERRIVLVGSQTFHMAGDRVEFCDAVLTATANDPGVAVVIKPHPLEDARWHRRFVRRFRQDVTVIPPNASAKEAIHACDVLVTFYSTVAVEAMVLERPVVVVNLTGRPDLFPWVREGAALGVYCREALAPALRTVLHDGSERRRIIDGGRRFAAAHLNGARGDATARVLDVLFEYVEGGRSEAL